MVTRIQKHQDVNIPEWHDAYVSFRPLLFSALGRLARQGYPTDPSEAPEIIHDFLAEAWPGLTKRFDPSKANFRTYAYGAFLRFARSRIVQTHKWRSSLVSPEEMALIKGNKSENIEMRADLAMVKQALKRLPDDSRRVLKLLTSAGYRERRAAAILGVSRHRFRCLATEALAQFAVQVEIPELMSESDLPLARALWSEGRSLEDAAAAIGISVQRARVIRRRILRSLEEILSEFIPSNATARKEIKMTICEFWQKFTADPTNQELVTELRARADELFEHLQECEDCDARSEALQSNLPAFYEALGATMEITEAEAAAFEDYERATAENNERVKDAIESVLLKTLGPSLKERLLSRVRGDRLVHMFVVCEALAMKIHRYARHEGFYKAILNSHGLVFARSEKEGDGVFISRDEIIDEIRVFTFIDEETAGFLLDWTIAAARSFPNLMIGIKAEPEGKEAIRMELCDRDPAVNLYEYWKPQSDSQYIDYSAISSGEGIPAEMEAERIAQALEATNLNREAAAAMLKISEYQLSEMMKKFGI
ncbi:MAG: helix-turn-helix domain-containing protein [Desulfobacterales bacterium]|jgi:RNA polymerase sigma factor (sigma-70 family)